MKKVLVYDNEDFKKFENKTKYSFSCYQKESGLGEYSHDLTQDTRLIKASILVESLTFEALFKTKAHLEECIEREIQEIRTFQDIIKECEKTVKEIMEVLRLAKESESYSDFFNKIIREE